MLKPPSCDGCNLVQISNSFSRPEGEGTLRVAIVGEALTHDDAVDGLPFRPRSLNGSLLEKAFKDLGYRRNQFKLWNLCACQPPGGVLGGTSWEEPAISHCRVHFDQHIPPNKYVIVALGNTALKWLTSASGNPKDKQSISYLRGFVLRGPYGLVVGTYPPGFLRRGAMKYYDVFKGDIRRAVAVAQNAFNHPYAPTFIKPKFQATPSIDDAWSFYYRAKDSYQLTNAIDIETPMSGEKDVGEKLKEGVVLDAEYDVEDLDDDEREIDLVPTVTPSELQTLLPTAANYRPLPGGKVAGWMKTLRDPISMVQFSLGKDEGIALPWEAPYIRVIKEVFKLPNRVMGWNNWGFDEPRLKAHGCDMRTEQSIDLMWKWHHLQPDLDRNLQYAASCCGWPFPWKHFYGSQMGWYGCADVAVLHWIDEKITPTMRRLNVLHGWERYVLGTRQYLQRASGHGCYINLTERSNVYTYLDNRRKELYNAVQAVAPFSIRNIGPKRKLGVAKVRQPRKKKLLAQSAE